jgi:hypothetical protein
MKILGVGVLKYENLRLAFQKLANLGVVDLYASIEHEYKSHFWKSEIDIIDFTQCVYGDYDLSNCNAIDADILYKLESCEVDFLRMIERIDYLDEMSFSMRKYAYLDHVKYWNNYLSIEQPQCVVFCNFPHEMYDYVIYSLCKIKGIRTLIFDDFNILPDTLFLIENIEESCLDLKENFDRREKNTTLGKLKNYLDEFYLEKHDLTPIVIKKLAKESKIIYKLFDTLVKISQNKIKLRKDSGIRYRPKMFMAEYLLLRFYNSISINSPNLDVQYIYMPLHYQPECSSNPMGGKYVDQFLIADLISQNLPDNTHLYIKEHPLQKKHGRNGELYRRLNETKGITLIGRNFPSIKLINKCIAVATITGTAGWEGFLKGKPVLKFGSSFYQYAPCVFKIYSEQDLVKAIGKITAGLENSKADILAYVKAIEISSIDSWVLGFIKEPMSSISQEVAVNNIANALKAKISVSESS